MYRKLLLLSLLFVPLHTDITTKVDVPNAYPEAVGWAFERMLEISDPREFRGSKWTDESIEESIRRYSSIAEAAVDVVFDPEEEPIFDGPDSRFQTLSLLLSVAYSESRFRRDVDLGLGPSALGADKKDWCLMQVRMGPSVNGDTDRKIVFKNNGYDFSRYYGYGGRDLLLDHKKCFKAGLHIIRDSFKRCKSDDVDYRLSAYLSGKCGKAKSESKRRVRMAYSLFNRNPPVISDSDVTVQYYSIID